MPLVSGLAGGDGSGIIEIHDSARAVPLREILGNVRTAVLLVPGVTVTVDCPPAPILRAPTFRWWRRVVPLEGELPPASVSVAAVLIRLARFWTCRQRSCSRHWRR